jgi:hypothetical protein
MIFEKHYFCFGTFLDFELLTPVLVDVGIFFPHSNKGAGPFRFEKMRFRTLKMTHVSMSY